MTAAITGSGMRTCLGDSAQTVKALLAGESGIGPIRYYGPGTNVTHGYHIREDTDEERLLRCSGWLAECVAEAVRHAGVDPAVQRVTALVGTGLRELRSVERWAHDGAPLRRHQTHFAAAVREALNGAPVEVVTVSNACAASGHMLALGQDLLDLGEADAVVVAGCDSMSESMLAMIGLVTAEPTTALRPFETTRTGVLLGEGAAAVVLEPADRAQGRTEALVRGVGLSCDAYHETAPDVDGIVRAMTDAHTRAGVSPDQIGLVLAHGTGTALNDPTESTALRRVFGEDGPGPLVTGIKGATGHTSGGAALMSVLVAAEALRTGQAPPVVGLDEAIPEAGSLRLVRGGPQPVDTALAQINAFGFGGVNAVTVIEVTR